MSADRGGPLGCRQPRSAEQILRFIITSNREQRARERGGFGGGLLVAGTPSPQLRLQQAKNRPLLETRTRERGGVGGGLPVTGGGNLHRQPAGGALMAALPPLYILALPGRHAALHLW